MRVLMQLAVVVVLAGVGTGGWYYWKQYGGVGAATDAGTPAGRSSPVPVEVAEVRAGAVIERVEAVGTARANESVIVAAKQTGNVATINFIEGQRMRAGSTLVELEAGERRADVDQAHALRDEVRQRNDRARQLRGTGSVTEARLDELESLLRAAEARVRSAEARLQDARITAPFDGRVGLRQVSLGALLQPGTQITTLDDISRIKLDFSVPETVSGRLKPGLAVLATTPAYPARVFEGKVSVIDTRIDPATRSVRVNALFDNSDEALKPGLFLSVVLALSRRDDAPLLPEDAVLAEGLAHFVFVVKDNRVERRQVKLGQRRQGEIEVLEGLSVGDTVVVRGLQKIRGGQSVAPRPLRPTS